jgi:hypothetical protein
MLKKLSPWLGITAIIIIGLAVGTVFQIASAYINPPEDININIGAPLTTGVHQTKSGGLTLNELGTSVHGLIVGLGDVGIGDVSPDRGLKLDVEGKVGATEYCDENGENCKTTMGDANICYCIRCWATDFWGPEQCASFGDWTAFSAGVLGDTPGDTGCAMKLANCDEVFDTCDWTGWKTVETRTVACSPHILYPGCCSDGYNEVCNQRCQNTSTYKVNDRQYCEDGYVTKSEIVNETSCKSSCPGECVTPQYSEPGV